MGVFAAVMTGPGAGAIATIQLCGESARTILQKIFRPRGRASFEPTSGRVFLGSIVDADSVIDQVTIGCEARTNYAIHCHGNPLLVERIMELLQRCGARLIPGEKLLGEILASAEPDNAIAVDAKLALATARTVDAAKMLAHQIEAGLSATARRWRQSAESGDLEQIRAEAGEILRHSEAARLILTGCIVALIGPANTGKSTLLNTLAGRDKALVTDTKGTTRDWVSAEIHIPPLAATVIDTAGLDADLAAAPEHDVDRMAQAASREVLARADLVLLVLDSSRPACQLDSQLVEALNDKKVVTVFNKSDLPQRFDPTGLADHLHPPVHISAKRETGIEELTQAIRQACNVTRFDPHTPVAFTPRQRALLERLTTAPAAAKAARIIDKFLQGPIRI
jgi:tRNA modification GTPase